MSSVRSLRRDREFLWFVEQASARPEAPIVVMLHGFPGDALDWSNQFDIFRESYHVVAPFMPGVKEGRGASRERLQIESLVEDVATILEEIDPGGDRPLYLVGHDLGCFLSGALAQKYGARVKGIININGMSLQQYRHRLSKLSTWLKSYYVVLLQFEITRKLVADVFPRFFLRLAFALCGLDKNDEKFRCDKRVLSDIYIYRVLFQRISRLEQAPVRRVSVPTLFLWGNRDVFLDLPSRSEVDRFYSNATIRVVPGGHWVNRSQKDHVNRILKMASALGFSEVINA